MQDAIETARVLREVYSGAFPRHRILHPLEAARLRKRDVSPGVLLEGANVLGESRRIRKIRDLYRLNLIETLVALAENLLNDEILVPAMLAATAKRYKEPEEKIINWLKPPRFFTSSSFPHMLRDNILRGNYEKRAPALYEEGFSLSGMPWVAKRTNGYLENLQPSLHKFKLDASNCDATLPPELVSGSSFLIAEDLVGATHQERKQYFNALQRSSADQRVGVIRGTRTGVLHPKCRGGATGIVGTFNQNNASIRIAYTDALAHSEGILLKPSGSFY